MNHSDGLSTPKVDRRLAVLAGLIVVWGVALRLVLYFTNRSLWTDEAMLALNLIRRGFAELMLPLDYAQVAPIGFVLAAEAATYLLGLTEYGLRLVPLLSGLAALPLFGLLAWRMLPPVGAVVALALFALSDPLIYYSSELKPYSSDVLITILLLLLVWPLRDKLSPGALAVAALAGAAAVWFSFPSVFVLAGIGFALALPRVLARDWSAVARLGLVGVAWVMSFVGYYLHGFPGTSVGTGMMLYWTRHFVPFPPRSLRDLIWYPKAILLLFEDPVGLFSPGLALLLAAIGLIWWFRTDRAGLVWIVSPLLAVTAASALQLYPFRGRLLLFTVPLICLIVAAGVQCIWDLSRRQLPLLGPVLLVVLFLQPVLAGVYHLLPRRCDGPQFLFNADSEAQRFINARQCDEIRPALAFLARHAQPGDVLYVDDTARRINLVYAEQYGLDKLTIVESAYRDIETPQDYYAALNQLRGQPRAWYLLTRVSLDDPGFGEPRAKIWLDARAKLLASFERGATAVYLYQFD